MKRETRVKLNYLRLFDHLKYIKSYLHLNKKSEKRNFELEFVRIMTRLLRIEKKYKYYLQ